MFLIPFLLAYDWIGVEEPS